ncbi:site-specific integrase [Micromonospora sp. WMMD1082]|uniref:site-specific integrase n=1 Tax=Micromonospora sp. WMMD1082 TaxID=3016104 RepID=UPI0024172313|nr:site-specific integrase [Micromonospora sp. WMMD1082]MDG4797652.1 site-specific integrase [Micromonospora sp. WMMD1082]
MTASPEPSDIIATGPASRQLTLSAATRDRLRRAMPESTRRAYTGDLRRFLTWCAGRRLLTTSPPAGEVDELAAGLHTLLTNGPDIHLVVTEYVNTLADAGRAPASIERALAAIAAAHRAAGAGALPTEGPRAVLRAYRRDRATSGTGVRVRKATPVTISALRAMVSVLDRSTPGGVRDTALLVLGFAMGARRSELAALDIADLAFTPDGLEVTVRTAKTDRDSIGRTAALPWGTHPHTCPVRTAQAWLSTLAEHGRISGPLLVRIDRHGRLGRVPTGRGSADGRLTGQAVALIVARTASAADLDPRAAWSGHSLRRGFATETYRAGADPLRIARAGGWKDGFTTLYGYIEDINRWQANPLTGVGL